MKFLTLLAVALSSNKCTYCKSLRTKASAKCPKCKCSENVVKIGFGDVCLLHLDNASYAIPYNTYISLYCEYWKGRRKPRRGTIVVCCGNPCFLDNALAEACEAPPQSRLQWLMHYYAKQTKPRQTGRVRFVRPRHPADLNCETSPLRQHVYVYVYVYVYCTVRAFVFAHVHVLLSACTSAVFIWLLSFSSFLPSYRGGTAINYSFFFYLCTGSTTTTTTTTRNTTRVKRRW